MIKRNNIVLKNENLLAKNVALIDVKAEGFNKLMSVYNLAMKNVEKEIQNLRYILKDYYGYEVINNISSRIKEPQSIINKMKKKNYDLNYKDLVENVKDIAGVRIVCFFREDVLKIRNMLGASDVFKIAEDKDYFTKPKKSGYRGYHIIVEVPIRFEGTLFYVNVEIQIRTMAMDFWSTLEHKAKYKTKYKVSRLDSLKLICYAKIIDKLDEKMGQIYKKQLGKKAVKRDRHF